MKGDSKENKSSSNSNGKDVEAAAVPTKKTITTTNVDTIDGQLLSNAQLKMKHNNNNNGSTNNNDHSASKTILAQEETPKSGKGPTIMSYHFNCAGKWILLLAMAVTLIITAISVAMLTVSLLDNEDQCFSNNLPFQQTSYKLFSTKTAYSSAYNYLDDDSRRDQESKSQQPSIELPSIFSRSDSLQTLNKKLTSREPACRVRQLHYFGRHAARFPSEAEIETINQYMANVQSRIDLSKFSPNNNNSISNNAQSNGTSNPPAVCFNPLAQYKQWSSFMAKGQGNLVMDSGFDETSAIAKRLKAIYPEMFDSRVSKIEIGATQELRTAQTAAVFLSQMENFSIDECSQEQNGNVPDPRCSRAILQGHSKEKLEFHKKCESLHVEDFPILHNLNLKEPNRTRTIAQSVSKKLKLTKDGEQLSSEETEALYKICKYETALTGSSIWCNLFSERDIKFYEYLSDVDDFFNQAYGHPNQMMSACPVTSDLMRAFKAARQQPYESSSTQPEAHFYFTHSQVVQKILAASVDLEQDPEYSPKNVLAHLQAGTTPQFRQWRTSLFTPFSANLAFTLYECPKPNSRQQPSSTANEYIVFDTNYDPFKVVASLNERPILLDGCQDYVCDLSRLLEDSRINREKRCRLEEICRKNIVVT